MMSVEPGVLDAKVLTYAVNADAPQYAASRASVDNPLRYVADIVRVLFDRHQPAPGCCGFVSNSGIEHNCGCAGASRSACVADPDPRGCGLDATVAASPGHRRKRIRFANCRHDASQRDQPNLHFQQQRFLDVF